MTPSFSVFALGSGGGPLETNLSSYLCKTYDTTWEGDVFALEAGSGIGMLSHLLRNDNELLSYFGFEPSMHSTLAASRVFSAIRTYLVTHSHLDHISGLVLSAGSFPGCKRKHIAAVESVLNDIENVFSGRLWPKLASRQEDDDDVPYLLTSLQHQYQHLCPNVSVRAMPITHGRSWTDASQPYESTAFFIRHNVTKRQFLFFGDVEPDSVSVKPQTIAVWKAAARLVPNQLNTIFLECSWPLDRDDALLFGHLSPRHVLHELEAFADEVLNFQRRENGATASKRQRTGRTGALKGLTLYVIHVKTALNDVADQSQLVARQIQALVETQELGIKITAVTQGMRIEI
ncbi:cyclic-AMP phosphodiesterase [Ramaria rubella]|nr:cyclic-AMP phosphodiesterase [Ramaria rubella]KAF8589922.1 cyclic-AMP phosphodiesterase [Ramaria rubella]